MNARFLNDGLLSTVRDDIYIYIYDIHVAHESIVITFDMRSMIQMIYGVLSV